MCPGSYAEVELRERTRYIINLYKQPALVEAFLSGREFTLGVMGRPDAPLYSPHPEWYNVDGFHHFPILELDSSRSITPGIYGLEAKAQSVGDEGAPGYLCPAEVDPELAKKLHHFALRAHFLLGALDISRTDMRLDGEGQPRLMEINPLPGLTPGYSDLCLQAAADGITYEDLILEILYLGASRWGMLEPHEIPLRLKKRSSSSNGKSGSSPTKPVEPPPSKPAEPPPAANVKSAPSPANPPETSPASNVKSAPPPAKPAESPQHPKP